MAKTKPSRAKKKTGKAKPAARKSSKAAKSRKPTPTKKKAAAKPKARPAARPAAAAPNPLHALAQRIVELTRRNDDEATYGLYADDVESTEGGQPPTRGLAAIREKFAGWRKMVTSSRFEPRGVHVAGNTIVIEWSGHVTLAPSGKEAVLNEVAIHEIRNGKIVRERYYYDPSALAQPDAAPPS